MSFNTGEKGGRWPEMDEKRRLLKDIRKAMTADGRSVTAIAKAAHIAPSLAQHMRDRAEPIGIGLVSLQRMHRYLYGVEP